MSDISFRCVAQADGEPRLNVIFVHGLGGDPVATWCHQGGEDGGYFWPRWLADEIEGAAVYTLGYPADTWAWATGWPLAAVATAVLGKLMASPELRRRPAVPIAFVCHSNGGLIVKKLMLMADGDRKQAPRAGHFLDRIAGVVFLATPHGGSRLAALLSSFLPWLVSDTLRGLNMNGAELLDLAVSYRTSIAQDNARIRHRVFYEQRRLPWWMLRMKPVEAYSSDPGLDGRPVPVDRDHIRICKPASREDTVYEGVVAFLADEALQPRELSANQQERELSEKLDAIHAMVSSAYLQSLPYSRSEAYYSSLSSSGNAAFISRLRRLSNVNPEVTQLRREAADFFEMGKLNEVDVKLAAAEALDLDGLQDLESFAREQRLSAAESRAARGVAASSSMSSQAYRTAAFHYAEAARIASDADRKLMYKYTSEQSKILLKTAREFDDSDALTEAIDLMKFVLQNINKDDLSFWAEINSNLGAELAAREERRPSKEREGK